MSVSALASVAKLRDRLSGMLYGLALGDVLGSPFEFRRSLKLDQYHGKVEYRSRQSFPRFKRPQIHFAVGQLTDDTEMTILVMRHLIENNMEIDERSLAEAYMWFYNSDTPCRGAYAKQIFARVSTYEGYLRRAKTVFAKTVDNQSNGALMRCSPFALISDAAERDRLIVADCNLSHPNKVIIDSNLIYANAVNLALHGNLSNREVFDHVVRNYARDQSTIHDSVRQVLDDVAARRDRNCKKSKGWCLHGLHLAMYTFLYADSFEDAMRIAIMAGGDTDTNAAIAGALNGAYYGLKALESDPQTRENIELILKCTPDGHSPEFPTDTPRDPSVHASQLPLLVESYIGRFLCRARDDVLPPSKRF